MQEMLSALMSGTAMTTLFVTHDIDEALIIGDQIAVMTARPGRVLAVIENPFARPRSALIFDDENYGHWKSRIFEMIRQQLEKE